MEGLAIFIGQFINWIILGLALITVGGFAFVVFKIGVLNNRMIEDRRKNGGRKDYPEGGYKKNADVYTWEDNLAYLEDFNKIQLKYSVFEQCVPVFPLLGILGTVAGLIQQLGNIDEMKAALTTSMSTTFWGLVAAILLKIIDAVFVSKTVNKMNLYFETFDQNYQMTKDKHLSENEKKTQE